MVLRGPRILDLSPPHHAAPFPEQLAGQWLLEEEIDGSGQRLRFYEDGRFAFFSGKAWTAGSYFILRSDERKKGVCAWSTTSMGTCISRRCLCEIHFETHAHKAEEDHDHDHGGEPRPRRGEGHS